MLELRQLRLHGLGSGLLLQSHLHPLLNELFVCSLALAAFQFEPCLFLGTHLLLSAQGLFHLLLIEPQLPKLLLDRVLLLDRLEVLLLNFELMGQDLVLSTGLLSLFLPPPQTLLLLFKNLLVQKFELLSVLPHMLLLLLLL